LPATTISAPEINTPDGFLPATPSDITSHMASLVGKLDGDCLQCHGINGAYNLYPLPPDWNGAANGSGRYTGFYYVVPGSIQDHTGRTSDICLTCHKVVQ
jgi:mono/diheme cytochrome c family protein